jgi:Zn-dependent protease
LAGLDILIPLLLIILVSLSFHEAAHAWTANRLGDPTARSLGRLTLNPLAHIDWFGTVLFPLLMYFLGLIPFGWAKPVPVDARNLRHPRRDFAVVALAGPVSNLILAAGAAVLLSLLPTSQAGELVWWILYVTLTINVLLAVFNMLPIPPLDGGNVLAGVVPESVARLIDAMRPYGFLILIALLYLGVIGTIVAPIQRWITRWLT